MKKSQKTLLTVLLGLAALIVVNIGLVASSAHFEMDELSKDVTGDGQFSDFNQIDISGNWNVNITQGDEWTVTWSDSDAGDHKDKIDVYVKGDTLKLRRKRSGRWWNRSDSVILAEIVMPELNEIEIAGGGKVNMSGFEGDELEIEIAGAVQLLGSDGDYDELQLEVAGASEIDLRGIVVREANVNLAGASDVTLTLDGGKLSGEMAGAGQIEYYGSVSEDTVKIAGVGRVKNIQ